MMTATQARTIAEDKSKDTAWEAFGKVAAFIALIAANALYYGFAMVKLWAWFIVQPFHVAPLAITTAIGIDLIATALHPVPSDPDAKDKDLGELLGDWLTKLALFPTTLLLIGYVVHLFV